MTNHTRSQRYRAAEARYWGRYSLQPEEIYLHLEPFGVKVRV